VTGLRDTEIRGLDRFEGDESLYESVKARSKDDGNEGDEVECSVCGRKETQW
jgi:hypothetical protein